MDGSHLIDAIISCDLDGINEFLNNGGNINGYFSGLSPLIFAIHDSHKKTVFLEESILDINEVNFFSDSKELSSKSNDIILRLISAGADVNVSNPFDDMTPLMLALKFKRSNDVVFGLINAGCDVNAKCGNWKSPLIYAIESNCDKIIIRKLLSKGADVNHRCKLGKTPLFYAVISYKDPEIMSILIKAGSDINAECNQGKSVLIYAIKNNCDKNLIRKIINEGADVNHICTMGRTALFYAAIFSQDIEIVTMLIDAGSCINPICTVGKTPLIYAIQHNSVKNVIKVLIDMGANVNHRCNVARTPLFYAVGNRDAEIITYLFRAGASINVCDIFGRNVLSFLNECINCSDNSCNNKEVVDLLLSYGIDLKKIDEEGNTLIHWVNCKYLIGLAIRNGISIEVKNNHGVTPLLDAGWNRDSVKVNNLLLLNADPNSVFCDLNTPLHYLQSLHSDEIVNLLLYHGADLYALNIEDKTPLDIFVARVNNFAKCHYHPGAEAFIKHFILFCDEYKLDNSIRDYDLYNSDYNEKLVKFRSVIRESKAELSVLRHTLIKDNLTFYEFCVLKKFYRNKFVDICVDDYKFNCKQIKVLFPLYQDLIIMRIKDNHYERCRKVLVSCLEKIIFKPFTHRDNNFHSILDYDCLCHIASYLNNKQLYNLFLSSL